jgi:predicted dehydrogenase
LKRNSKWKGGELKESRMKNIAIVGFGFIGKTHFEAYRHIESAQVTAICTRDIVKAKGALQSYSGSIVTEFEKILEDNTIDIIDICLPTYLHKEYIIKAANAGKQIICEKPLTLTEESANLIVEAVSRNKVNLFVAQVLRFWPEYQAIKQYCETGKLANIEMVHAQRLGQRPKWSSWFQDPDKSGGALFDLHIHDIDFLFYLLGEVETVYSVGAKNQYGAWDHIMTTVTFKSKCKAYIEASQSMPMGYPFTMSFRAVASDSALEFNLVAGENIDNLDESSHQFFYYHNQKKNLIEVKEGDAFHNQLSYFVHCVENNQQNTVIPLRDVLYTLKLLKAIETSLENGCEIQV